MISNGGLEDLNCLILKRYEEQKCRKAIRKAMLINHKNEMAILKKISDEQQQRFQETYKNLLLKKKNDSLVQLKKLEQNALQQEQINDREIEALHTQTRRALRLVTFNGISQCQEIFRDRYSAVVKLLLACQRTEIAHNEHNNSLKELIDRFELLITKIKSNDYGPEELRAAQCICEQIEALEQNIVAELETLIARSKEKAEESFRRIAEEEAEQKRQEELQKQRHEQQQKEEEQQQLQEQQQQQQQLQIQSQQEELKVAATSEIGAQQTIENENIASQLQSLNNLDNELINSYTEVINYYQQMVDKVKLLKNDESLKKYRFAIQKSINTPINTISAVSPQHLQDKFDKLYGFINGQTANEARVTDHPLGREYCLLLMAKKFVSQGTTTVSSNPQAAFPIASVLISLWKLVPELGQLFLAYLYKESPYMVPCFLRQQPLQSREDFLKLLGYHFTNNEIEPSDMYLKRQAGIARLYAAVIITNGRQTDGPIHPHGLPNAWRWITRFITLGPLPDLSATIITEFLQIVGAPMLNNYGRQFIKLLVFIQHVYFPQLSALDKGGPKARLELQLNKFLKEGRVELPAGILPPGYW